jgi:LysW-gamma-L-lysine carboxypeptidase
VAEYLVGELSAFADEAFVDQAGNAVAIVGSGPLRVTFLGHIDTFPGEIPVRIEDGRLYGRGSVDAKGPFCAAVSAASRLPAPVRNALTFTLVGATEEEAPSSKGARHALEAYPPPDLLIVGEPSGWDAITLGYKGRLLLGVEARKASSHSAGRWSSAAEDVVAVWNAVRDWSEEANRGRDGIFESVQATLQRIGSGDDGLEQFCSAAIGFRLPPWLPPEQAMAAVEGVLPNGPDYAFNGAELPYRGPKDTPLTRAFRSAIREAGGRPRFKLKTGTSDMNVVAPRWRCPAVAYGPGDSDLDHSPSEHVELDELLRATEVLAQVLFALAESPERS